MVSPFYNRLGPHFRGVYSACVHFMGSVFSDAHFSPFHRSHHLPSTLRFTFFCNSCGKMSTIAAVVLFDVSLPKMRPQVAMTHMTRAHSSMLGRSAFPIHVAASRTEADFLSSSWVADLVSR